MIHGYIGEEAPSKFKGEEVRFEYFWNVPKPEPSKRALVESRDRQPFQYEVEIAVSWEYTLVVLGLCEWCLPRGTLKRCTAAETPLHLLQVVRNSCHDLITPPPTPSTPAMIAITVAAQLSGPSQVRFASLFVLVTHGIALIVWTATVARYGE